MLLENLVAGKGGLKGFQVKRLKVSHILKLLPAQTLLSQGGHGRSQGHHLIDKTGIGVREDDATLIRTIPKEIDRTLLQGCRKTLPANNFGTNVALQDRKSTRLNSSHVRISYAV